MNNLIVPVYLACDENYVPYLATAMYSILKNTTSHINFFILDGGILPKSKLLLKKSLEAFNNFDIEYLDITKYNLNRFPNLRHYSLNAFSRYFIPKVTPNIVKGIYLDVDIIVKKDITDLFNIELEHFPLAAVSEDFYGDNAYYLKNNIYPEYKSGLLYFNTGVLLVNISEFIKKDYCSKLINLTIKYSDKLSCPDQDVFNIVFEDNFKILDYKYNFMPDYYNKLVAYRPEIADTIKDDAYILHYTRYKPWKSRKAAAFKDFWDIAEKTLFIDRIKHTYETNQYNLIKKVCLFGFIPIPKSKFFLDLYLGKLNFKLLKIKKINDTKYKYYLFGLLLFKIALYYE